MSRDYLAEIHPHLHEFFEDRFDYHRLKPGIDPARLSMRHPENIVGHVQRAFSTWWALKQCSPLDLGIDFGSHRGLTPLCFHVDRFYNNVDEHPIYGGKIPCDIVADASEARRYFPPNAFPYITSNHSLEHMPAGDETVVRILLDWMALLRSGGVLAMVIPDNDHWAVLPSDPDHKHAWGASDFRPRVLDKMLAETKAELVEYDTFQNFFSFNAVVRKP